MTWAAGGVFPADPIWLVPGSDGRAYLVGDDGHVYSPDQLPMVKLGYQPRLAGPQASAAPEDSAPQPLSPSDEVFLTCWTPADR